MTAWSAASSNFGVMKMYDENFLCATAACTSGTAVNTQGDVATNFDTALNSINSTMPDPGKGTNVVGDTPQEVLFLVTDGLEDELIGGVRVYEQINGPNWSTPDYCTTIKNRGIRIAVLYTAYLALPNSSWYKRISGRSRPTSLRPFKPARRRACSYQAAIGDDLGADLIKLFETATQSPRLTN